MVFLTLVLHTFARVWRFRPGSSSKIVPGDSVDIGAGRRKCIIILASIHIRETLLNHRTNFDGKVEVRIAVELLLTLPTLLPYQSA